MSKGTDLGTYHVKVIFNDDKGFVMTWNTGGRFMYRGTGKGSESWHSLDSTFNQPIYESEEDLIASILFMFEEGNYACDCNLKLFLAYAHQEDSDVDFPCGDTMNIKTIILVKPDGSEKVILEEK